MNKVVIKAILEDIKKESFISGYKATDTEAMGLLISKYFEWDGIKIMEALTEALTDANFHTEAEQVNQMLTATREGFSK